MLRRTFCLIASALPFVWRLPFAKTIQPWPEGRGTIEYDFWNPLLMEHPHITELYRSKLPRLVEACRRVEDAWEKDTGEAAG